MSERLTFPSFLSFELDALEKQYGYVGQEELNLL